ncbi:MAG: M81 family metallopeptidase, partial [Holdemania massiliensis]
MKKILIGALLAESNAYVQKDCEIQDFTILTGPAMADKLAIRELAEAHDVQLIPSLHASCMAAGCVDEDTFDYLQKKFIQAVKAHQEELDGIYLFLHGASHVRNLPGGSGDHFLLHAIRKLSGRICRLRFYAIRTAIWRRNMSMNARAAYLPPFPHSDRDQASQIVFQCLLNVLQDRRPIHPVYRKVPILLGGERCVSADEPLCSINQKLDQIEADPRILCCSYHIGYLRHDSEHCGAGIVVVPNQPEDEADAEQKADEIYDYVWQRQTEFHFTGNASEPD